MAIPTNVRRVIDSVLGHNGHLSQALRTAAADHAANTGGLERPPATLPEELLPYIDKVCLAPYKVVDRDIEGLKASGLSEDEIFELTLATVLGAASGRLEKTLNLLDEDPS